MATTQGRPKKPRLSLQIKTSPESPPRQARLTHNVDPLDPTAFNTLSNVYATAIERSTPLTAINTLQSFSIASPVEHRDPIQRVSTPHTAYYPETPLSASAPEPGSPRALPPSLPSVMTATPPMSGSRDPSEPAAFPFSAHDTGGASDSGPRGHSATLGAGYRAPPPHRSPPPPYTQPRILRSILRNSPLPPRTAIPPPSPRRQSLRLQEKAARRVGYNSPLEQEIVTNKYIKSHIDLLTGELSPWSPPSAGTPSSAEDALDAALAFTPNEIRDGGQTPGPFEETRRRMASRDRKPSASSSSSSPPSPSGIRKRKRKEMKRRWVWTINQGEDDDQEEVGGAVAALRAEATRVKEGPGVVGTTVPATGQTVTQVQCINPDVPTPSVESVDSAWSDSKDVDMVDAGSVAPDNNPGGPPMDAEQGGNTPTVSPQNLKTNRDTPIPELATDSQRNTPMPPDMANRKRETSVLSRHKEG